MTPTASWRHGQDNTTAIIIEWNFASGECPEVSLAEIELDNSFTVTVTPVLDQQLQNGRIVFVYAYNGLDPGTSHTARVRGSNGPFWSEWSDLATLWTEASTPPAPGSITASQAGDNAFVEVGALPYTGGVALTEIELWQLSSDDNFATGTWTRLL